MAAPRFVHLRLHSEFSIVDGMVRVDDAIARGAADGMPALALTDLANVFGLVKFYQAARARGREADRRLRRLAHARGRARQAVRARCCCAQSRAGYLQLCDWLSRAYRDQPAPRPRGD